VSCSNYMNGYGCTACEEQTMNGMTSLVCTACDSTMGLSLETVADGIKTWNRCEVTEDCEIDKYFDGSGCVNCIDNCEICNGPECSACLEDFVMLVHPNMTRECVAIEDGCPSGQYVNAQFICTPCDSSCDTCFGKRRDQCITCKDATQVLRPIQMLRVDRINMKNDFEFEVGKSEFSLEYEIPEDVPSHGVCAADCMVEGFALWNNNGTCEMCSPHGCSECDSNGMCTQCSKKQRLSLIDNPEDSTDKWCEP